MTLAITPSQRYLPPTQVTSERTADAQVVAEALIADPQTRARVRQVIMHAESAINAAKHRVHAASRYVSQIAGAAQFGTSLATRFGLDVSPATLGPAHLEVAAHPEALEELKRLKERESRLAMDLGAAIDSERRATLDLLRAFNFLQPHEVPKDKTAESPGEAVDPVECPEEDCSGLIWNSHAEFYGMIAQLLGALKEQWLSKYQDAMKVFLEFYDEFSDAMDLLEVGRWDDEKLTVHFKPMMDALKKLKEKFGDLPLATFDSKEQADAWVKSIGLPGLKAEQGKDGWVVKIDMSSVDQIMQRTGNADRVFWDPATYNAWVSAKDSNVEQIKHTSKVLGEKLSEMDRKLDEITKVLSSTIDKINQVDMGFANVS